MTTQETLALFDKYVIPNYARMPVVFVRGEGSRLWDADGNRYLDLFPGWGVDLLGHCHPKVIAAIREQAGKLLHVANNYYMEPQGILAEMLSTCSFGGQCFFCNSGAEANEAAIKLARLHAGAGRHRVITMFDSFHGRTLATVAATGQTKYQEPFKPLLPEFVHAPLNNLEAVQALVEGKTAAVMVEPIQGEGGVNVASAKFLRGLREMCDREGMLLIFDEVQTGCGRTGKWFGYQQTDVVPDIMTLAKGLGGGVAVGGIVARPEVAKSLVPGTHASTFGGNPIACAGGIATLRAIEEEGLLANAERVGAYLAEQLRKLQTGFGFIKEVRGLGMMIGAELDRPGKAIVDRCREQGLLINVTHDTVLRMLPAMTLTEEEADEGIEILKKAMAEED